MRHYVRIVRYPSVFDNCLDASVEAPLAVKPNEPVNLVVSLLCIVLFLANTFSLVFALNASFSASVGAISLISVPIGSGVGSGATTGGGGNSGGGGGA